MAALSYEESGLTGELNTEIATGLRESLLAEHRTLTEELTRWSIEKEKLELQNAEVQRKIEERIDRIVDRLVWLNGGIKNLSPNS